MLFHRLKSGLRGAAAYAYHASGCAPLRLRGKVLILCYHRVVTPEEAARQSILPGMYVLAADFARQMRFLRESFTILPLAELLERWSEGELAEDRPVCVITFDDGWVDSYLHAFPVLRSLGMPATVFLPTAFVGSRRRFWQDRLCWLLARYARKGAGRPPSDALAAVERENPWLERLRSAGLEDRIESVLEALKRWPEGEPEAFVERLEGALEESVPEERVILDWEEVREMGRHDITFGAHSQSHRNLTQIAPAQVRQEMEGALRALAERDIPLVPVFCYPNGDYTAEIMQQVQEAGYRAALTTRFGLEGKRPRNLFALGRIVVHGQIAGSIPLFSFHLSGFNDLARRLLRSTARNGPEPPEGVQA